jgi:hypothetical protein
MNTKSLNRSIGLAMSALQQARAYGYSALAIDFIRRALRWLNKARACLKSGEVDRARLFATTAHEQIKCALIAR